MKQSDLGKSLDPTRYVSQRVPSTDGVKIYPRYAICIPESAINWWCQSLRSKGPTEPVLGGCKQRWAKGPIDRSSDTDSIFRLYRTIQSVDAKFRFLNRPIVSVRFEFRFFNRPILFFGFKFRFLYRATVSASFK
jgi:hypothetical protein